MARDLAQIHGLNQLRKHMQGMAENIGAESAYAVGTTQKHGRWLEEGTSRMPPYPWLGPATASVVRRSGGILDQADTADAFIATVAAEIEREATKITESTDQRPYRQSGDLSGSITSIKTR